MASGRGLGPLLDAAALAPAAAGGFGPGALAFRPISRTLFVRLTLMLLASVGLIALAPGLR